MARIQLLVAVTAVFLPMAALSIDPNIRSDGTNMIVSADTVQFETSSGNTFVSEIMSTMDTQNDIQASIKNITGQIGFLNNTVVEEIDAVVRLIATRTKSLNDTIAGVDQRLTVAENNITDITKLKQRLDVLESFVAAIPLNTPTCDPVSIDNGDIITVGDHGARIPIGVTIDVVCNDGFYVDGPNTKTCQTSNGTDAFYSEQDESSCQKCPDLCATCTSSNVCTKCKDPTKAYPKKGGVCVIGDVGEVSGNPGASCLAIKNRRKDARSGFQWIYDRQAQKSRLFQCDMDGEDGGWTLVGNGVGGNVGCWVSSQEEACFNETTYLKQQSTFKFSDLTIQAIQTRNQVRFSGNGSRGANWYWKDCEYYHFQPAQQGCNCAYNNADFSDTCNPNNQPRNDHVGTGDWGGGRYGCLHSNQRAYPPHGWYLRRQNTDNCDDFCRGWDKDCDVQLWVK